MKKVVLFAIILVSTLAVKAEKMYYPIEVLAGTSDLIVLGQIEHVNENSYTFKITETLKGKAYTTITVEIFSEWTCDRRFGKPKKGQPLCLFLEKGITTWTWEIINGSTGELLISNDSITFIKSMHQSRAKLSISEFKNGIRAFCTCFELIGNYENPSGKHTFRQLCNDQQISRFKGISTFSDWLYDKMKNYTIVK